MNNIKSRLKNWSKKWEKEYYCSLKNGYLFHNYVELRNFNKKNDYFSLDDEF